MLLLVKEIKRFVSFALSLCACRKQCKRQPISLHCLTRKQIETFKRKISLFVERFSATFTQQLPFITHGFRCLNGRKFNRLASLNLGLEANTVQRYQHSELLLQRAKCYISIFLQRHGLPIPSPAEIASKRPKSRITREFLEKLKTNVKKLGDPYIVRAFDDCIQASKIFVQNKRIPSELLLIEESIDQYLQFYKQKSPN
jgi:hypothetical protein